MGSARFSARLFITPRKYVGKYDTEPLIFIMAAAGFLHIFEEETNKMKEKYSSDNHRSNRLRYIRYIGVIPLLL